MGCRHSPPIQKASSIVALRSRGSATHQPSAASAAAATMPGPRLHYSNLCANRRPTGVGGRACLVSLGLAGRGNPVRARRGQTAASPCASGVSAVSLPRPPLCRQSWDGLLTHSRISVAQDGIAPARRSEPSLIFGSLPGRRSTPGWSVDTRMTKLEEYRKNAEEAR